NQIAVLSFEKLNSRMGQRFQRCAKTVLHSPRAVGNAPQLSIIAAKKCDDAIRLPERIRLQDNRVALMERHIGRVNYEKWHNWRHRNRLKYDGHHVYAKTASTSYSTKL